MRKVAKMLELKASAPTHRQRATGDPAPRTLPSGAAGWERSDDDHQGYVLPGQLNPQEKREYLEVLSDVIWDIESELAKARAERAALMTSIQADSSCERR